MPTAPFEVELDTRFRDIDAMGHVNNAVYATYVEQARVRYVEEVAGVDLATAGLVIANLSIDFRRAVEFGDAVTVRVTVPEVGETSMPFEFEVLADGDLAATAETRLVHVDRETGDSTPIPDAWRQRVADFENH